MGKSLVSCFFLRHSVVYDSRHLQADFQEPGSAPEPYARQSSMGYLFYQAVI